MGAVDASGRSWRDARFDMIFWLVCAALLVVVQVLWLTTHSGDWTDLVAMLAPVVATLILAERRRRLMRQLRAPADGSNTSAATPI